MNMTLGALTFVVVPLFFNSIAHTDQETESLEPRPVELSVVGGREKEPIRDARVTFTRDRDEDTAVHATTNMAGEVNSRLAPGVYYVDIEPNRPVPFLSIPPGFKGHPDVHSRWIRVTEDEDEQAFNFELAHACQLTLKAIDIDSGEPIPGVVFATECASAEQWAQPIRGDNLGNRHQPSNLKHPSLRTDEKGEFQCLIGPRPGWVYFVWDMPDEFERADESVEVTIDSSNGRESASHTFKLRRKNRFNIDERCFFSD